MGIIRFSAFQKIGIQRGVVIEEAVSGIYIHF